MFKKTVITISLLFCLLNSFFAFATEPKPFGSRPEVKKFIREMVNKYHFNETQLVTLFNDVKIRPQVIRSINAPLEQNPWYRYQMMFVTEWRIREGINFWNKHKETLERAEKIYGVPASIIVATIGIETKYGRNTGEYRVIDALTNIAFGDTPRASYFRKELIEFLLLTREKHLNPLGIMGSYAGAIGQPQFMPSSYRSYAVNFSGNGKIDLSYNVADVIGSIANYYHQHGWIKNDPVAIQATTSGEHYQTLINAPKSMTISKFASLGVHPRDRIAADDKAKLIELQGVHDKEYWLSFHNFDVIKRYNTSTLYAMAINQLSEYITEGKGRSRNG